MSTTGWLLVLAFVLALLGLSGLVPRLLTLLVLLTVAAVFDRLIAAERQAKHRSRR